MDFVLIECYTEQFSIRPELPLKMLYYKRFVCLNAALQEKEAHNLELQSFFF